jgi:hypothetical protein
VPTSPSAGPSGDERCARCGRSLIDRSVFTLGRQRRCLPCALRYRPMLRRSALTSLVVGTILVAINQGAVLFSGQFPPSLTWQIPLTYLVPFCVASWGALSNSRDRPTKAEPGRSI